MSAVKSTGIPALLTLPVELTNEIIRDLENADLKQLRLTCKVLSKDCIVSGRLFHTLYVDLYQSDSNTSRFTASLSFCAAVKSKRTVISPYVKRLVLTGEEMSDFRLPSKVTRALQKVKALFLDKERLVKTLVSVLPRLTGLESLE
ncbi:hypothetical protein CPB85DRAFT_1430270 [Mucidula mucida]|nr:hypothetical protein CPB85DRAFT_1430270 [Mucidula mucida]